MHSFVSLINFPVLSPALGVGWSQLWDICHSLASPFFKFKLFCSLSTFECSSVWKEKKTGLDGRLNMWELHSFALRRLEVVAARNLLFQLVVFMEVDLKDEDGLWKVLRWFPHCISFMWSFTAANGWQQNFILHRVLRLTVFIQATIYTYKWVRWFFVQIFSFSLCLIMWVHPSKEGVRCRSAY